MTITDVAVHPTDAERFHLLQVQRTAYLRNGAPSSDGRTIEEAVTDLVYTLAGPSSRDSGPPAVPD